MMMQRQNAALGLYRGMQRQQQRQQPPARSISWNPVPAPHMPGSSLTPFTPAPSSPSSSDAQQQQKQRPSSTQNQIQATYWRGGTSRGVFFDKRHLPSAREAWPPIFRGVIGSPDAVHRRQLDGLGGGVSSLSKVCVMRPGSGGRSGGCDVEFEFFAVGVDNDEVDASANCGNLSAAIGPWLVDAGYVVDAPPSAGEHVVTVRVRNVNTDKLIDATFAVHVCPDTGRVEPLYHGDFAIDGVAPTAAPIRLAFVEPAGSKTGALFPTGRVVDEIDGVQATCIDAANPAVFVRAADLGVPGDLTPADIDKRPELLARLDRIRRQAGALMGVAPTAAAVPGSIPKITMVAPAASCILAGGRRQDGSEIDLLARTLSVGQPHKAIPITTALAAAAAARTEGTVVSSVLTKSDGANETVTIGHAGGKIDVGAEFDRSSGRLVSATVFRTARKLFDGVVYWR